jgi:hypothetical protein
VDEFEPEAEREEQAEQEEDPAALLADPPVDQRATGGEAKPATRRSLRVKGGKVDLVSLSYKGRPL